MPRAMPFSRGKSTTQSHLRLRCVCSGWSWNDMSWRANKYNTMLPGQQRRSQSVRPKRIQAQQFDNQTIQYRGLNALMMHNMCLLVKSHRNVLGEVDLPVKFKISNEQLISATDNAPKLYEKMAEKLSREALARNGEVRRTYEGYYRAYKVSHPDWQYQRVKRIELSEQIVRLTSSSRNSRKSANLSSNRPSSSKPPRKTAVVLQQFYEGVESMQSIASSQIYKVKKVNAVAHQNPQYNLIRRQTAFPRKEDCSRERKRFFQLRKRYQDQPNQAKIGFLGNMAETEGEVKGHRRSSSGFDSSGSASSNPRMKRASWILGERKAIEEMDRLHFENKISMVNSVLSVSAVSRQGYRPKTRVWNQF